METLVGRCHHNDFLEKQNHHSATFFLLIAIPSLPQVDSIYDEAIVLLLVK